MCSLECISPRLLDGARCACSVLLRCRRCPCQLVVRSEKSVRAESERKVWQPSLPGVTQGKGAMSRRMTSKRGSKRQRTQRELRQCGKAGVSMDGPLHTCQARNCH